MNARIALCLLALACSVPAIAADTKAKDTKTTDTKAKTDTTAAATPAEGQMSAEDQAMMKAWEAAGSPDNKNHEYLKPLTGTFDVKVSSWMADGAPVMTSTGRSESRAIFGGRYIEDRFSGTFMGQPFEGIGYTGYDNVKKQYFSSWIDSMSTMMMTSTGKSDEAGRVFTFGGECTDPMTGKAQPFRQIMTIKGPNEHIFEMWGPDPKTGKEYKTMELVYTRASSS